MKLPACRSKFAILMAFLTLNKTLGQDMTQMWGWPEPNDKSYRTTIMSEYMLFGVVTRVRNFNFNARVNAMKFIDLWKNGATVYMKKEPPFRSTEVTITSRNSRGFNFIIEIYYDPKTYVEPQNRGKR